MKFGNKTAIGAVSKPKSVTIKNGSPKKTTVSVMITGETAPSPFTVSSECVTSLAPGKSCKVSVTFTPQNSTAQNAQLTINDDEDGAPQKIPLSGTGKAAKKKK